TPLNVILSVEQLITTLNDKKEPIQKEKLKHYMTTLKNNSKRLLKLINDIIDTSKIESGSYKLDIEEHDIVYVVEELALSMKDFIENNGLELIIDPKIETKIIECDAGDIEKCLVNIIGNAVKFTEPGGKIEIDVEEKEENVIISISDTGIGIDEENIEEIFNRFGQAYNKKSEEFGGSGIGLELTKQLILLHKGDLSVESEVGVGSKFIIVLPVKQHGTED
ncbi:MAG: HAMP domain-containing histidine kinase, partial [Clostridia bacterium]|nr:HAMP domain-containing histidine kinase [Clostridia bacterium]